MSTAATRRKPRAPRAPKIDSRDPANWTVERVRAAEAAAMSEEMLQRAVEHLARLLGYLCYHTHDSRRSAAGYPDLAMVKGPRLVYAELKSARGRLRAEQETWLAALRATGRCEVYVWRPADWLNGRIEEVLR